MKDNLSRDDYMAQVKMCMKKIDCKELKRRIEAIEEINTPNLFRFFFRNFFDYLEPSDDIVVFGWNYIEWNKEHKEIAFIEDFLNEIKEQGHPYKFIRVGIKKTGDIEISQSYGKTGDDHSCDRLYVVSDIYLN